MKISSNISNYSLLSSNLLTVEETNFFIKNIETYLKNQSSFETNLKAYSFMSGVDIVDFKNNFHKYRSNLLTRKRVKIYTPITISNTLIRDLYIIFAKISKDDLVLDPIQDNTIVAGLKFSLDGKVYNLTIDSLNSNK